MSVSLTKKEIIRQKVAIQRLIKSDYIAHGRHMSIKIMQNRLRYNRVLIVVARGKRKIDSVLRNSTKRIGRELFRLAKDTIQPSGYDVALFLRPSIIHVAHAQRTLLFRRLLDSAVGASHG